MKMVCFCEKVHFRFLYPPSSAQKLTSITSQVKTLSYLCHQILTKTIFTA